MQCTSCLLADCLSCEGTLVIPRVSASLRSRLNSRSTPVTNDRPVRESEDNAPNPIEKAIGDYLDQLNSGKAIGPKEVLEENPLFGEHIIATVESFVDLDSVGESP